MKWKTQILNFKLFCFSVLTFSTLKNYQCHCISLKSRIIDGRSAKNGQFPWQVIIKESKNYGLRGGASLISPDWVLTAAHCTYELKKVYLKVGTNYIWARSDVVEMTSSDIHIHPEYNDSSLHNDISLIKLPSSLKMSDRVRPIRLVPHKYKHDDFIGRTAIITGFGYIGDGFPNPFSDLLFAEVTIISNPKCKQSYEEKVFPSTMCSIGVNNSTQSICDGDSGGPLVLRDGHGKFFQIGIVSFSAKLSCSKNYPAAYTRLTSYFDYIRKITKLDLK